MDETCEFKHQMKRHQELVCSKPKDNHDEHVFITRDGIKLHVTLHEKPLMLQEE